MREETAGKTKPRRPPKQDPGIPQPEEQPLYRQLGHYQVLTEIGHGGMSVVYKGMQPSLNRAVAIKVLPPQFVSTPELLGRFDREASIVAQLNHPNIVQVIDRGKDDDTLYIVMEYVDGESLEEIIHKGSLKTTTIIDYAVQICDGLEYAHSMGVVHRDLKPSNILVDARSNRVKIADFGIAQLETTGGALATLTYDGAAIGTMNYMAPEQRLDSHAVTHLADIFSFGVVLYQMLTSKLPIGHFKAPSMLRPDLPFGLDAIVRKCLAESPADRYPSAAEIRRDLVKLTHLHHKIDGAALLSISRLNKRQIWGALGAGIGIVLLVVLILAAKEPAASSPPPVASPAAAPGLDQPDPQKPLGDIPQAVLPPPAAAPPPATLEPVPPGPGTISITEAAIQADFARAQGFIAGGKHRLAVDLLTRVLAENPGSPQAPAVQFAIAETCYAMGEKERCKTAYDQLVRNYPESGLVPAAVLGSCQAHWDTAPRRIGFMRPTYDKSVQRQLVEKLQELVADPAAKEVVPGALRLIAEIAEPAALGDLPLAAASLLQLHELQPTGDPKTLLYAAEILDRKLNRTEAALEAYGKFLVAYPADSHAGSVRRRVETLKAAKLSPSTTEPPPGTETETP